MFRLLPPNRYQCKDTKKSKTLHVFGVVLRLYSPSLPLERPDCGKGRNRTYKARGNEFTVRRNLPLVTTNPSKISFTAFDSILRHYPYNGLIILNVLPENQQTDVFSLQIQTCLIVSQHVCYFIQYLSRPLPLLSKKPGTKPGKQIVILHEKTLPPWRDSNPLDSCF